MEQPISRTYGVFPSQRDFLEEESHNLRMRSPGLLLRVMLDNIIALKEKNPKRYAEIVKPKE